MRKPTVAALLLLALVVVAPSGVESQGLGGLIKKKAIEAVKGKDAKKDEGQTVAKADGPITSQFEKECGPLTPDVVDRLLKGMEAELAQRGEFDRKHSSAKPDEEVNTCRNTEAMGTEIQKLLSRGITKEATNAQLQNAIARNMSDVEAHLTKKCGEPVSKYGQFDRNAARLAGAKAAGVSNECYDKLKEFALFFCKGLTSEQQNAASAQGIKAPGQGSGVWVYTADEAKALAPRCSELLRQLEATDYRMG